MVGVPHGTNRVDVGTPNFEIRLPHWGPKMGPKAYNGKIAIT